MTPQSTLTLILAFLTFNFLLDTFLGYLNLKSRKAPVPEELNDIYDEDTYAKSQAYHAANGRFGFLTSAISFVLYFLVIASGFLGWWDAYLTQFIPHDIGRALAFFGSLFIVSDVLTLPFQYYATFVIEEKFGFNKSTVKLFFVDKLKGYLLTAVLGGGILYVLLLLITTLGTGFWVWFWIIASALMLLINMFYTSIFVPLFNKLTPLEEGELKDAIMEYCQKVDFPLTNLFTIDGSKRSSKSNAYFSGIGKKKKIVLFDTLIENHSKEELVAILAHEVGHYKKKHIISGMLLSVFQTGVILFVLSLFVFNAELSAALGRSQLSIHLNLIAFSMLFSPISQLIGIVMNMISRKNEFEADTYAAETYNGKSLVTALKKLASHNLSNLTPHPFPVFLNYSHPPMLKRVKHILSLSSK